MTYQGGQRGPNVSEFIANLNAIPSAQDIANQDNFNLDDDLAMFTNTQFFDFDLGQDADLQPTTFGFEPQKGDPEVDTKGLDFISGDFSFPDFTSFTQQPNAISNGVPIYPSSSNTDSPTSLRSPRPGDKRPLDAISDPLFNPGFDDPSRAAAEEDKRRRNTAASARFRVKKKQREQALEKSAKEMTDKVNALESRINQLETENKWLKNLVMEKNGDKDDIAALWKKYNLETAERKGDKGKDGVGTESSSSS